MTTFSLIVLLVIGVSFNGVEACSGHERNSLSGVRPRSESLKPTNGIAPCLIPPMENLVYQYEGAVEDRPGIRTGCYTKADAYGSSFPPLSFDYPLKDSQPLQYYVVDDQGQKKFVSENNPVWLDLPEKNGEAGEQKLRRQVFNVDDICFPLECYNDKETYLAACSYPHMNFGIKDCFITYMAFKSPFLPCISMIVYSMAQSGKHSRNLGRVSTIIKDTWLYCEQDDNNQLIPIMTREFPLGQLLHLKQKPKAPTGTIDYQGFRIVQSAEYRGRGGSSGCDISFPLEAPFDKYEHRFWHRSWGKEKTTIVPGQTVEGSIRFSEDCLEWQRAVDSILPVCVKSGRLYDNFTFEDFCFPAECYMNKMDHRPVCTGKAGDFLHKDKDVRVTIRYNQDDPDPFPYKTIASGILQL